jgi:hypothetical protein
MKSQGYTAAFIVGFLLMVLGGGMQYLATGKARQRQAPEH